MTPQQRDDLARMSKAAVIIRGETVCSIRMLGDRWINIANWHPESSRDDCQPLVAEIERRGYPLWKEFVIQLHLIVQAPTCLKSSEFNTYQMGAIVEWIFTEIQPADIVAAFKVTIEEADRKEGE